MFLIRILLGIIYYYILQHWKSATIKKYLWVKKMCTILYPYAIWQSYFLYHDQNAIVFGNK